MVSRYKRTDKLKNCCIANTICVVSSLNGPISSLVMMVNDKKKIPRKTNMERSALSLSVTNCFPKGLELSDIVGNGNYEKCLLDVSPIITQIQKVENPPASNMPTTPSRTDQKIESRL